MFIFHENNLCFMLLSGIFFVSLHHQLKEWLCLKRQIESSVRYIHGSLNAVRKSGFKEVFWPPNAWYNQFYSLVTTKIDEEIFKPLFPEGRKSGQRSTWKRIPPRPFTALTLIRFRAILPELVICSNTVFIHVMARPDTGACSNIVCMHIADVCGWTSEGW